MRFKVLYISLLLLSISGYSQEEAPTYFKNIVHVEAGGIGGYGSINYERAVPLSRLSSVSGRIGISTIRLNDFTNQFNPDLLFPITINGFFGSTHKFHIGFGQLISSSVRANHANGKSLRTTNFHTHFAIGYRYKKEAGRLILGISYTPIIEFQEMYKHWGAVTVGCAF